MRSKMFPTMAGSPGPAYEHDAPLRHRTMATIMPNAERDCPISEGHSSCKMSDQSRYLPASGINVTRTDIAALPEPRIDQA
jgi:hypothetical protein